MECRIFYCM